MNDYITNYITWSLAESGRYDLKSDIPADQIAVFSNNLFFRFEKAIAECAEAVRQVVKAEGKRYFIVANNSTYLMEDMRYILESGLARIAGHAFVDSICKWTGNRQSAGAAVVFEII